MTLWGELADASWCYAGQVEGEDLNAPVVKGQIETALCRYRNLVLRTDDGLTVLARLPGLGKGGPTDG